MSTLRAPTARAAAMSVSSPSPIMIPSLARAADHPRGLLEDRGCRLADRDRRHPGGRLDGDHDRAGPRPERALGRERRIPVRGDEPRAGADRDAGDGELPVRQVLVESDDHGVGSAGDLDTRRRRRPSARASAVRGQAAPHAPRRRSPPGRRPSSSCRRPGAPTTRTRWSAGSWFARWSAVARAELTIRSAATGAPIAWSRAT